MCKNGNEIFILWPCANCVCETDFRSLTAFHSPKKFHLILLYFHLELNYHENKTQSGEFVHFWTVLLLLFIRDTFNIFFFHQRSLQKYLLFFYFVINYSHHQSTATILESYLFNSFNTLVFPLSKDQDWSWTKYETLTTKLKKRNAWAASCSPACAPTNTKDCEQLLPPNIADSGRFLPTIRLSSPNVSHSGRFDHWNILFLHEKIMKLHHSTFFFFFPAAQHSSKTTKRNVAILIFTVN